MYARNCPLSGVSTTFTATMVDHHHMGNMPIYTTNPYPFSELHFQQSAEYNTKIEGAVIYQGLF